MNAGLKRRLETIEAGYPPPSILGDLVHVDGQPTRHTLFSQQLDVERWLRTGALPRNVAFFVTCESEAEHLRRSAFEDEWQLVPALHPDALKTLERIIAYTETSEFLYNFDGYVFRGVGGVLPPSEQVKELMPYG